MTSGIGLNPWRSILTKPKQTIRMIVDYNPNYRLMILSAIYGFSSLLGIAQNLRLGDNLDSLSIIILSLILAPLWGYLLFSLSSWFLFICGRWLKGAATFKEIRAALAWSKVPMLASIVLWIMLIILFKKELFQSNGSQEVFSGFKIILLLSILMVQLIASIWSIVIYINALAEVQRFSILRAIGNIILVIIVTALFFMIIFAILKWMGIALITPSTLVNS